mgnify:CR=1 FL=1
MQKSIAILFFFVLLVLSLSEVQAQRKTYLGVKAGYNRSTANLRHSFTGNIDNGFENGLQAGLVMRNYFKHHIGIQMEVNYSQKGWTDQFLTGAPDFHTNLDYIEIPLMATLSTGKNKTHFFANVGCFVEFLTKVEQDALTEATVGVDFHPFVESRDKSFGYGYKAGAGIYQDFDFGTLLLQSTVSYSLSNMIDNGSLKSGIPNTSNNLVLGFSIAYLFSFGGLEPAD